MNLIVQPSNFQNQTSFGMKNLKLSESLREATPNTIKLIADSINGNIREIGGKHISICISNYSEKLCSHASIDGDIIYGEAVQKESSIKTVEDIYSLMKSSVADFMKKYNSPVEQNLRIAKKKLAELNLDK